MPWFQPKSLLDKSYEIGILIKGVDGVLELIGGILVLTLSAGAVNSITRFLTQNELQENPHSYVAVHIVNFGNHLAAGHSWYAAAFLLTHGLVKVVLVTCLLLNKIWAYPWAIGALALFLIVQFYQLVTVPSFGMAFLTVLDIVIIWLVWREWQKQKSEHVTPEAA